LLTPYSLRAGIPLLEAQGEEWGMTPNEVNKAGNLCVALALPDVDPDETLTP